MSEIFAYLLLGFGGVAVIVQATLIIRAVWVRRVQFPKKLRPVFQRQAKELLQQQPPVVVFIPCKGVTEDFESGIQHLLGQDYKNFQLVYITESQVDPAAPFLRDLAQEHSRVHHVVAGQTSRCCQKNHNLIKGIEYANKHLPAEIYIFADGDIQTQSNWIKTIITPLADPSVFAVSGFRWLIPRSKRFAQHLHSAMNTYLGLGMTDDRYAGMWGGSMALWRSGFEKYKVAEKWSTAMVDDMALSWIIKRHKLRRVFSPDCLVFSRDTFNTVGEGVTWFTRQAQMGSNYIRPYAGFGAVLCTMVTAAVWVTPVVLVLTALGLTPWWLALAAVVCYVLHMIACGLGKLYHRDEHSPFWWMFYMPMLLLLGTYCGWRGFFSTRMNWSGIVYDINRRGEVLAVTRLKSALHGPAFKVDELFTANSKSLADVAQEAAAGPELSFDQRKPLAKQGQPLPLDS